ncbi:MAG: hypothetical protein ACFB51_20680 [Anaerolineae bacterium]
MAASFEAMLTGGHPNSLGRTVEVVDLILADRRRLDELYACYASEDAVVRMRVSNAFKRIWREQPAWVVPYIDRFITEVAQIDQDSARWTAAQLFGELDAYLTDGQRTQAKTILKHNFAATNDWIVLNNSMQTLGAWAQQDGELRDWLRPHLERLSADSRKSVARKAARLLDRLT